MSIVASDKNYPKYEHLLSPGWIPGRKIVGLREQCTLQNLTSGRT
jgi:hypothetical protein